MLLHVNIPSTLYIDSNTALTQVNSVKYLGIQLTSDLSWSTHITTICSKTRRLIGLLYHQFHLCTAEVALRPHLEYASVVWDPHLAKETQSLEQTQKFALRMCFRDWSCPYQELLVRAEIPSLAERRTRAKLCHLYKIIHGLTDSNSVIKKKVFEFTEEDKKFLSSIADGAVASMCACFQDTAT